jgi:hypothetical protein
VVKTFVPFVSLCKSIPFSRIQSAFLLRIDSHPCTSGPISGKTFVPFLSFCKSIPFPRIRLLLPRFNLSVLLSRGSHISRLKISVFIRAYPHLVLQGVTPVTSRILPSVLHFKVSRKLSQGRSRAVTKESFRDQSPCATERTLHSSSVTFSRPCQNSIAYTPAMIRSTPAAASRCRSCFTVPQSFIWRAALILLLHDSRLLHGQVINDIQLEPAPEQRPLEVDGVLASRQRIEHQVHAVIHGWPIETRR